MTDTDSYRQHPEQSLAAPHLHLRSLSFAATDAGAIRNWVAALPLVNTEETAAQLGIAIDELSALDAAAQTKFEMIEAIRPVVHYVANRIDRLDRNRITADEDGMAVRLLGDLCRAYIGTLLVAITDTEQDKGPAKETIPTLLHRAISDMSRILLRNQQYYRGVAVGFWRELNALFRVALARDLQHTICADEENTTTAQMSIRDCFVRALLMASARPNQLVPLQLGALFNALEQWAATVTLDHERANALTLVDLAADFGPRPASFVKAGPNIWAVHTEVLAYELDVYLKGIDGKLTIPASMDTALLSHLVETWSVPSKRTFRRTATDAPIHVCVGLRSIHYFLAGGAEFKAQIANTDALLRREVNPFLDLDYEGAGAEERPSSNNHGPYIHYEARASDTSPEGYCVEWLDPLPPNAQVGELLALREESDARWRIGVTRWIHQGEGPAAEDFVPTVRMGVQLLSPRAIPVAIRAIRKTGGPTSFARAILLPALESIDHPATLIAPSLPFAVNDKVQIHRQGLQTTAQLLDICLSTDCVTQFSYRMLDGYLETVRSSSTMEPLSAMTKEDSTQGP